MSKIELKKTQVGALLKVISKDDSRPILTTAYVDKWGDDTVLVATNGYVMSVLQLDAEDAEPLLGKMIRREAIERWYKLATGKSRLTTDELVRVSSDDYAQHGSYQEGEYPKWQQIIPDGEPYGTSAIAFNADFAKVLQDLDDSEGMRYDLYGELRPMMANTGQGTYLMMPKKV